jgi:membrane-associated protease RseP (regulator of RpoE activity)
MEQAPPPLPPDSGPTRLARPPIGPPRRVPRPWVNLLLLALTTLSVGFAGWLWEGGFFVLDTEGFAAAIAAFFEPTGLLAALPYTLSLLGILGAHEMGHYLACRYYGIPATLPFFIPGIGFGTFGAVIRIRGIIPHRRALFDIAAAGPLAGFALALPVLILGILDLRSVPETAAPAEQGIFFGDSILTYGLVRLLRGPGAYESGSLFLASWFGLLVTSMNLFPVGQLDGGHIAYSISRRLHRVLSWTVVVVLTSWVVVYSVANGMLSVYTLWCVVLLWMRDRHPRVRIEGVPLGRGRVIVAVVLLVVFVLTFMPVPLTIIE